MKIVIYEKINKQFYQLSDKFEINYDLLKTNVINSFDNTLEKNDFETNGKEINSNLRLFTALNTLYNSKYKIEQLKLIAYVKKIDTCIYIVKINKIGKKNDKIEGISVYSNFEIISDEKLKVKYNKIITRYNKVLGLNKKNVLKEAWKNEKNATNARKTLFEAIITICLGLFAFVKEILNFLIKSYSNITQQLMGGGILLIASIVLIIGIVKIVYLAKSKEKDFKEKAQSIYFSVGDGPEKINNQIESSNLIGKYRHFKTQLNNQELFLYSDDVNHALKDNAKGISVKLIDNKQILSKFSREALACIVNSKLDDDKLIFNGELLGLSTDLEFSENSVVNIKKVNYFNYIANDEMIYKNISSLNDPTYLIKGTSITLNPLTKGFKDMEHSPLTNVIGINLIVIVHCQNKEYLIINQQSLTNDVNKNSFVPTASGSLIYSDYNDCKKNNTNVCFEELLMYGMFRELEEESYLNKEFIDSKKHSYNLLGVARLYSKSGKPDFFGKLELWVNSLDNILNVFDNEQEKVIKQKVKIKANKKNKDETDIEANKMIIVLKDKFINEMSDANMSPQLKYVKYLLKEENE